MPAAAAQVGNLQHLPRSDPAGCGCRACHAQVLGRTVRVLRVAQAAFKAYQSDNLRLARENGKLRRENDRLVASLEKKIELSAESPVFEGGLGGRTAVQQYANTNLGRFMEHMQEVGVRAAVKGREAAKFFLATVVRRDYDCLLGAPPLTVEEARRRADCQRMLSTEGGLDVLSDPENEEGRRDFINQVIDSCAATTTQEFVRRSGEMPLPRAARPDED